MKIIVKTSYRQGLNYHLFENVNILKKNEIVKTSNVFFPNYKYL
jgi:hypothetical protein